MILGELGSRPLCPRCKQNTRRTKASYCNPCNEEYEKERQAGEHSAERLCDKCGQEFVGRGDNYFCTPCRKSNRERSCRTCGDLFLGSGGTMRCRRCNREDMRLWLKSEAGLRAREVKRARRFGVTPDYLVELYQKQGGKCACCSETFDPDVLPHVDHDHSCCPQVATKKHLCGNCIRGLLCKTCNLMLGYAKDDVAILRAGITYLENFDS